MTKLISTQAFAAIALAVALPLTASANSAAEEQAFDRVNQPQTAQAHNADKTAQQSNIGEGQSAAMADALKRTKETHSSLEVAHDNGRDAHDWSGQSEAAADALRRVNQTDAS